ELAAFGLRTLRVIATKLGRRIRLADLHPLFVDGTASDEGRDGEQGQRKSEVSHRGALYWIGIVHGNSHPARTVCPGRASRVWRRARLGRQVRPRARRPRVRLRSSDGALGGHRVAATLGRTTPAIWCPRTSGLLGNLSILRERRRRRRRGARRSQRDRTAARVPSAAVRGAAHPRRWLAARQL